MEKVVLDTIKTVVRESQQQTSSNWVNLAPLGLILNSKGINYKNLGYLKLKEMFEDPELQMVFEIKKDESHNPPIYYVRMKEQKSLPKRRSSTKNGGNDISIMQWAYFPIGFPQTIQNLKDLALKEKWYFKRQNPTYPNPILTKYLQYTFVRLMHENKIAQSNNYAAFNTGLVDALYDPIYALFQSNRNQDRQPWVFMDFCVAGQNKAGKILSQYFNPLPEKAKYFKSMDDYIYDGQKKPNMDWEHIILEHPERFPIEFLEINKPNGFIFEDTLKMDETQRKEYYLKLSNAINADKKTYRIIKMQIENALETAIKRANWNYKTAIPMYYPNKDKTSLLLPLALLDESTIDIALVIERQESGNYVGETILPLEWAYSDARLITRPDSDWLVRENINEENDNILDE